jgi:tetratricopeptide (TPR) repeat protein
MVVSAQSKNSETAKAAIDKEIANTENPKKNTKAATWLILAEVYVAAFDAPTSSVFTGTPQKDMMTYLRVAPNKTESKVIGGETYSVESYDEMDLYYNPAGLLDFWVVTKPVVPDALSKAMSAIEKAASLETKIKADDYNTKVSQIKTYLITEAFSLYKSGNLAKSADKFAEAAEVSMSKLHLAGVDTVALTNAAAIAAEAKDYAKAVDMYQKALDNNCFAKGGIYTGLADCYKAMGNPIKAQEALEVGFSKFPDNQGILVGLINIYVENKVDANKLFDIIHAAQANEPNNASLYYSEGNVYKQLGNNEKAVELYYKSYDIDKNFIYGIVNVGALYYEEAIEIQNKASEEVDDAKYNALVDQLNAKLEQCIEPFEKTFNSTEDPELKATAAEYLKNIFFRFRTKGDSYKQAYDKYNSYLGN